MKKAIGLVGAALLACSTNVMAQAGTPPEQQRGTMSQALERVGENAAEQPGNPGLPKAFGRLTDNAKKHEQHQQDKTEKAGVERTQGVDRVERVERVERPEKAERPERVVRVERPEPPGRAKK